jgi:hypothetical protein
MRTPISGTVFALLLLAGCLQPMSMSSPAGETGRGTAAVPSGNGSPPIAAGPPGGEQSPSAPAGTVKEERFVLGGTILLRPAGEPILYQGSDPWFSITLPRGAQSLTGVATWNPPGEPTGLEFHPPAADDGGADGGRVASWNSSPNTQVEPPIRLTVSNPAAGRWLGYFGPSTVGAGENWTLLLVVRWSGPGHPSVQA